MKKKILAIGAMLTLSFSMTSTLFAASIEKVAEVHNTLKEITVTDVDASKGLSIEDAFDNMEPGEERTVAISLTNDADQEVSYYLSQKTLKSLEESSDGSGGAYQYTIQVGSSYDKTDTLLNTTEGGYQDGVASTSGLSGIQEIQDYTYLTSLDKKETKYVYLTLGIDGEGFDSVENAVDYSNAVANLSLDFQVSYTEPTVTTVPGETKVVTEYVNVPGQKTVVNRIVDEIIPLASSVKTGDYAIIAIFSVALLAGVTLIVIAIKKRKVERES